jgi:hypothetical protein
MGNWGHVELTFREPATLVEETANRVADITERHLGYGVQEYIANTYSDGSVDSGEHVGSIASYGVTIEGDQVVGIYGADNDHAIFVEEGSHHWWGTIPPTHALLRANETIREDWLQELQEAL